jgi:Sortase domain
VPTFLTTRWRCATLLVLLGAGCRASPTNSAASAPPHTFTNYVVTNVQSAASVSENPESATVPSPAAPATTATQPKTSVRSESTVAIHVTPLISSTEPVAPSSRPTPSSRSTRPLKREYPRPLRIRVPVIGLNEGVSKTQLAIDRNRKLNSPDDPQTLGWYQANGPLIVVGHVDSSTGPAVFFHLAKIGRGDRVSVDFDDGTSVTYVASQVSRFPKQSFPTDLVYRAPSTDIRLVTCGGRFDRRTGHYVDNVIVLASPLGTGAQ